VRVALACRRWAPSSPSRQSINDPRGEAPDLMAKVVLLATEPLEKVSGRYSQQILKEFG
jgi:hypothetical protein